MVSGCCKSDQCLGCGIDGTLLTVTTSSVDLMNFNSFTLTLCVAKWSQKGNGEVLKELLVYAQEQKCQASLRDTFTTSPFYFSFPALKPSGTGQELRSCVKLEVAVLGSPSLTVLMDSLDTVDFTLNIDLPVI